MCRLLSFSPSLRGRRINLTAFRPQSMNFSLLLIRFYRMEFPEDNTATGGSSHNTRVLSKSIFLRKLYWLFNCKLVWIENQLLRSGRQDRSMPCCTEQRLQRNDTFSSLKLETQNSRSEFGNTIRRSGNVPNSPVFDSIDVHPCHLPLIMYMIHMGRCYFGARLVILASACAA